jgi:hypothetical protein
VFLLQDFICGIGIEQVAKINVLIAVPGLGADVNVAIAVDIGRLGFVATFAAEDYVLFEYSAFAV